MSECLFCRIVAGEIPSEKIFENDHVLGFKDLYPQAKEHYLFINKSHSKNVNEMNPEELWSTTLNPNTRNLLQVKYSKDLKADALITGHYIKRIQTLTSSMKRSSMMLFSAQPGARPAARRHLRFCS